MDKGDGDVGGGEGGEDVAAELEEGEGKGGSEDFEGGGSYATFEDGHEVEE